MSYVLLKATKGTKTIRRPVTLLNLVIGR
jgi:hypothetical protein